MLAAANGEPETVGVILNAGADVYATDENGWTASQFALQNCHYQAGKLLTRSQHQRIINSFPHRLAVALNKKRQRGQIQGCVEKYLMWLASGRADYQTLSEMMRHAANSTESDAATRHCKQLQELQHDYADLRLDHDKFECTLTEDTALLSLQFRGLLPRYNSL
jgi:hypothetical protein